MMKKNKKLTEGVTIQIEPNPMWAFDIEDPINSYKIQNYEDILPKEGERYYAIYARITNSFFIGNKIEPNY